MTMQPTQPITNTFSLSKRNSWLLWLCQLVNIASVSLEITTWMLAILALCLCWQAHLINSKFSRQIDRPFSPILLFIIAVGGCIVIVINAYSLGVLLSMLHLLVFSYLLKAFEIKQRKDFYQLLLLGLFLLASALIFKQSLVFSIAIVLAIILNLVVLQQVFSPTKTLLSSTKLILVLLLQSSLLAIVLFVVFPRLSPFWQIPKAKSAQTGLSDEVSPGDIANLALSGDLAFRVDFKGENIPQYSQLYWRAMTLENYDGSKWSSASNTSNKISSSSAFVPVTTGASISYDVIAEPSYQSWLFSLAVATSTEPTLRLLDDYTVKSNNILSQISAYQFESFLQAPLDLDISNENKQRNLAIVNGSNPKLEKLALTLKQKYPDPIARSNAVLARFKEQNYYYTLKPPLLNNNSLDQFFFDTQAGFCVHYATTYTYIMRAAGVPARVVTGYLGGEYNSVNSEQNSQQSKQGGHLSVYQYDAHAWSEIWIAGIGWQRVDPTAAVDPQRIESGWSNALLTQQSSLNNNLLGLYRYKNIAWINTLRLQLDALDYQWTRLVLGYSTKQQYDLLKRWFGNNMLWKSAAIVVATLIIIMMLFSLLPYVNLQRLKRKKIAPHFVFYQQLLITIAQKGLTKPADMSPSTFAGIVAKKLPEISTEYIVFTKVFEYLLYKDLTATEKKSLQIKLEEQYFLIKSKLKGLKNYN